MSIMKNRTLLTVSRTLPLLIYFLTAIAVNGQDERLGRKGLKDKIRSDAKVMISIIEVVRHGSLDSGQVGMLQTMANSINTSATNLKSKFFHSKKFVRHAQRVHKETSMLLLMEKYLISTAGPQLPEPPVNNNDNAIVTDCYLACCKDLSYLKIPSYNPKSATGHLDFLKRQLDFLTREIYFPSYQALHRLNNAMDYNTSELREISNYLYKMLNYYKEVQIKMEAHRNQRKLNEKALDLLLNLQGSLNELSYL